MQLTRHELKTHAEFLDDSSFSLNSCPYPKEKGDSPLGLYELPRRSGEAHLYRLGHPLAEAIVEDAKNRDLPTAELCFDYGGYDGKITILKDLIGQSGWLNLSLLTVEALDQAVKTISFFLDSTGFLGKR